jgi:hypothetical protein
LFLIFLLAFSSFSTKASNVQTVPPLADTYVEAYAFDTVFGGQAYLRVANSRASLAIAFLMFDLSGVSYVFNASSDVELYLYCHNVTLPYAIGVHWCLNNTWNEDTLAFDSIRNLTRSNSPESVVTVSSNNTWYKWTVTFFVGSVMQQRASPDRITLVLEPENSGGENDTVSFYSKDQSLTQYYPQLVFSYKDMINPLYTYLEVGSGFVILAGIILVAYRFSGRKKRRSSVGKSFSKRMST